MADPLTFPDLISANRDQNAQDNVIHVQLSDGTTSIGVTGGALDVNIDNASIVVTAVDLDIRDLVHTQDSVLIGDGTATTLAIVAKDAVAGLTDTGIQLLGVRNDVLAPLGGTDGDYVPMQFNALGALYVTDTSSSLVDDSPFGIATDTVSASGYLADDTAPDSVDEGDIGLARMTLDRKQLFVLTDATTDSQRLAINASGEVGVVQATHDDLNANVTLQINDVDVSATVPVPISGTEAANSELNPIFVHNVDTVISGEEVHDFDTSASVGVDTADNHDYTAVGTFLLKSVIVAGAGSIKFEIINDATGTPATVAVGFLTARQGDTKQIFFDPPVEVATGEVIRVVRTNRQNATADVYSTIIGNDV